MTCPNCRTLSCYVCRKVVTGYEHFDQVHLESYFALFLLLFFGFLPPFPFFLAIISCFFAIISCFLPLYHVFCHYIIFLPLYHVF
ncbi:hypothetical protein M413DRAFT_281321 [Hebeloma cylindrosporum]|uniref:Uncharacterized protein n=1 Tax=Hebeloma cylindrosporum TaxID=76867 RepID=A0A0C2Y7T5_HEBCY|nr:hypothetical protein M413DRAFT_281321 [Hebeloma cylindrosporum h7]